MATTKIEWADVVWNPVTGCTKVSPGCAHCYAERMAQRLQAMGQPHYVNGFQVTLHEDAIELPLKWKKPRRIFVNSMSDLFHEDVPSTFIDQIFAVMALASQHTFQILTKRADRMQEILSYSYRPAMVSQLAFEIQREHGGTLDARQFAEPKWPLPNVWLGVSAENQKYADERIPYLLRTPAVVRFLSLEPLLGPIDLTPWLKPVEVQDSHGIHFSGPPIDWVIVGGESGPDARPMHPNWARDIRDQCVATGIPFFFKQWGEWAPAMYPWAGTDPRGGFTFDDQQVVRVGKKRAGRLLDGRTWNEMPEVNHG